jgi:hypothetical protein
MAAPQVQDLTQIMAQLDPAYAQSRNLYTQQINGIQGEQDAGLAQLDQQKTRGFRDIARSANSRGLDFFGTPIEEQNTYLDKYLGQVGALKSQSNQQRMTLQQAIASLEQDKYKTALAAQQGQQSAANTYQSDQEKMAFQANQAQLDRQAKASSATAAQPPQWAIKQQDVSVLSQALQPKKGSDGYISPTTYANAKSEWVNAGYSSSEFDQYFSNLRNPKNRYYKVG